MPHANKQSRQVCIPVFPASQGWNAAYGSLVKKHNARRVSKHLGGRYSSAANKKEYQAAFCAANTGMSLEAAKAFLGNYASIYKVLDFVNSVRRTSPGLVDQLHEDFLKDVKDKCRLPGPDNASWTARQKMWNGLLYACPIYVNIYDWAMGGLSAAKIAGKIQGRGYFTGIKPAELETMLESFPPMASRQRQQQAARALAYSKSKKNLYKMTDIKKTAEENVKKATEVWDRLDKSLAALTAGTGHETDARSKTAITKQKLLLHKKIDILLHRQGEPLMGLMAAQANCLPVPNTLFQIDCSTLNFQPPVTCQPDGTRPVRATVGNTMNTPAGAAKMNRFIYELRNCDPKWNEERLKSDRKRLEEGKLA